MCLKQSLTYSKNSVWVNCHHYYTLSPQSSMVTSYADLKNVRKVFIKKKIVENILL